MPTSWRNRTRATHRTRSAPIGAMAKAPDAVEVCTDDLSLDEVLDRLEELVRGKAKESRP